MPDLTKANIVERGICLYGGIKEYEVIIVKSDILYGTGDYEELPEICCDRNMLCYYVWFEDLMKKGVFSSGCGPFLSQEEAVNDIESKYSVNWI